MSLKTAQRIAFKIYDRNGNGVIDEKDIIQLFDDKCESLPGLAK